MWASGPTPGRSLKGTSGVRKLPLDRQVLVGFGIAVCVLVTVAAASWYATERFMRSSREAVRHAEIVVPLERALSQLYEVEAAQRGYFFAGAPVYLQQRDAATQGWRRSLDELRRLAAGDSALIASVDELQRLAEARMRRLDEVLAAHADKPEQARALLVAGFGRDEMAALAKTATGIADARRDMLRSNADTARDQAGLMLLVLGLAVACVVALLLFILRLILRGIAERQRAYAALSESRARMDAVVETALDGIVVIDAQGRIERFNRAAERMFGYAQAEVMGRNVSMLMPSPYREEHDGYLQRYLASREPHVIGIGREVAAQHKGGRVFPVELAVAETRVGEQMLFTGLIRDISERKQAEERQAQLMHELRSANEELTNFAYVASHDLKAPLRAIGSLAQWLSADYADRFDEEGRGHMALLLSRVKRMDRLIDGILQYSRVGRVKETPSRVDLNALVDETVDLLAPPPHVAVRVGQLPTLRLERTRAQQLFQNLLGNAIQYMDKPEGRIAVACEEQPAEWHFRVEDNGPGIERRHWERVFQLFQSLKTRDATESTGIGLSLVKKIVEMYGGHIWLESEPGRGTTFHFTLPKEPACT